MDQEQAALSDDGERVVASIHDWNDYSHLSVYRFAAAMVANLRIADAGCGNGYGAAYLADHGAASVVGFDVSAKAIAYCQNTFGRNGLTFAVADLSVAFPAESNSLAVLNTLEDNLNTVLVARGVRRRKRSPDVAEFIPHGWGEGAMHAKVRREETELLRWKLWKATSNGAHGANTQ